ncbi:DUF350 domain-containing protein [Aestuariibacter halophilus]|uniref:DUF350 domain-containing protein n=1 Tax=Fluctibacter halophilus TaxID=226011 RepID=A0ABS8G2T3_9ALTE|nr:DUF350 domain-containing protein [Aestuariibacter halophilus]MCC2614845.1 DUF350 domain-containing protein [Aestuariibacter halophilus]
MSELVNLVDIPTDLWVFLAIDMAIAIALLFTLRWMSGKLASVDANDELCAQDNFAFGISVAGRMLSLCIVLSAAVASSSTNDFGGAALTMLMFGVVGILLIRVGRIAHDKIVLNRLDKDKHIKQRNTSIALVDAASATAIALIVQSVMGWVKGSDTNALVAIFTGFVVTLAILLATTRIYERRYRARNQAESMQKALTKGQMALAIQHAGRLVGMALVVTGSASLLIYNPVGYVSNLTGWLITGMALTLLLAVLVAISKRLILAGLDLNVEIDQQHNIGVASIELVLNVGIALIVLGLLH